MKKQPLNLTKKEIIFDYLLRHIAEKAKELDCNYWVAWFVDMIIFRNNAILKDIQSRVKHPNDMLKMYVEFRNAEL